MADERARLAQALTLLERLGIVDFNGHASLRRGDGTILINSGRSVRSALTAADIVAIDAAGELVEGDAPPPLERHIHTEIYRRRSDIGAIVHGHPKGSTLLTMTGRPYRPVFAQGALLGALPVFADPLSINTAERGAALAETLGQARGVLLRSHGAVTVGANIVEAAATWKSAACTRNAGTTTPPSSAPARHDQQRPFPLTLPSLRAGPLPLPEERGFSTHSTLVALSLGRGRGPMAQPWGG